MRAGCGSFDAIIGPVRVHESMEERNPFSRSCLALHVCSLCTPSFPGSGAVPFACACLFNQRYKREFEKGPDLCLPRWWPLRGGAEHMCSGVTWWEAPSGGGNTQTGRGREEGKKKRSLEQDSQTPTGRWHRDSVCFSDTVGGTFEQGDSGVWPEVTRPSFGGRERDAAPTPEIWCSGAAETIPVACGFWWGSSARPAAGRPKSPMTNNLAVIRRWEVPYKWLPVRRVAGSLRASILVCAFVVSL